jgi:hypothetical protein
MGSFSDDCIKIDRLALVLLCVDNDFCVLKPEHANGSNYPLGPQIPPGILGLQGFGVGEKAEIGPAGFGVTCQVGDNDRIPDESKAVLERKKGVSEMQ